MRAGGGYARRGRSDADTRAHSHARGLVVHACAFARVAHTCDGESAGRRRRRTNGGICEHTETTSRKLQSSPSVAGRGAGRATKAEKKEKTRQVETAGVERETE